MKYLSRYMVLSLVLFSFNFTEAQLQETKKLWDIQDCLQYALEHNIQINTLRLNEQSSLQDVSFARAAQTPSLFATIGNTFNNANNISSGTGTLINQLTSTGSYTVNSSVVLWNDNYINSNIRQKELLNQSAGLSVEQSRNSIILLITQAYLNVLLSKENLKYITDLVSASESKVTQGQMFYDAGKIAKKDLLQLQAQFASDRYLLVQTQNAIRQNLLSLKQILQLPTDSVFEISTPVSVTVASSLISLHEVQQAALSNFPEIKISKLGVDIASIDIMKARAGFKPVFTANGILGSNYSDVIINSVSAKTSYMSQVGDNFYQRIGLTLSIPIFSNKLNTTNLEKAKIFYKQTNLNLQYNQMLLSQTIELAYLNAMNAIQSYHAADQQLQAATESYRIANEEFKLGAINTYDLLQQRNQYIQAVQAYTQAKYSAVMQEKVYVFYMGNPVVL